MAVFMNTSNAAARTLSELLPGRAVPIEIPVTGISYDSRTTRPGDIFFALPGAKATGVDFGVNPHGRVMVGLPDISKGEVKRISARSWAESCPSVAI